eukprot:m.28425 g.28425  ORF g.28425 m.28425 type:complete len:289 (+) comp9470_c0_seq1:153-1019(+)
MALLRVTLGRVCSVNQRLFNRLSNNVSPTIVPSVMRTTAATPSSMFGVLSRQLSYFHSRVVTQATTSSSHGRGHSVACLQTRSMASKKKGKGQKKKKSKASFMEDAPEGRSKKKQMLFEKRKEKLAMKAHGAQKETQQKQTLDFSPKAQKCDLLTSIQREEMHYRNKVNPIPEFYAGSILRVSFKESLSRKNPRRMVGICIGRRNSLLGSTFTLRNVDDGVPFEAKFDLYSPFIVKIEVLQLARRRRAKLYYLRDKPIQDSYVSPSFSPLPPPEDGTIPVIRSRSSKR